MEIPPFLTMLSHLNLLWKIIHIFNPMWKTAFKYVSKDMLKIPK